MHYVKHNLSVGPQVGAKPDAMNAIYTDAITKSATTLDEKWKVWERFGNDAK